MEVVRGHARQLSDIENLFTDVFTASGGKTEGKLVGALARELISTTPDNNIEVFSFWEAETLLACIILSRLWYDQDSRDVFILSPVAVRTDRQNSGLGQRLIQVGLATMQQGGVDFVVTYGDPNYYGKTGFHPITERFAQPPLTLSQPHGWLGQFLSEKDAGPLHGPSRCVDGLNRQELW